MNIYRHLQNNIPESWEDVFREGDASIKAACQRLETDKIQYLPSGDGEVFQPFYLTKMQDVRVVIIGQGPYHNPGIAHGLCFSSIKPGNIPPSLRKIYQELTNTIEGFHAPNHGNLTAWTRQGVLMLNMSATVKSGDDNYRPELWMGWMDAVVNALTKRKNIIWMMWGKKAQKISKLIGGKGIELKAGHPSPFNRYDDFLGCGHFKLCNEELVRRGEQPIDWSL